MAGIGKLIVKKPCAFYLIVVILAAVLVYANSLVNFFVIDDYLVIVENNFIKSWKNFPLIFSKNYLTKASDVNYLGMRDIGSGEASYRPVVTISYFIDYGLWKLNAAGYHFTNLFLHVLNIILFYFFVNSITNNKKTALLASLFFGLHPVNTEAVCVISFREDLLCFLFCISSFLLYIKAIEATGGKTALYFSSALFFLLGLLSKEMAVVFPLLLIIYDYCFKKMPKNLSNKNNYRYSIYLSILLFYILIITVFMNNGQEQKIPLLIEGFGTNLFTMLKVCLKYINWSLLPINVHTTLPNDPALITNSLLNPEALISLFLIIGIIMAAVALRKKTPIISFAIFWFFISLIPVSNIFVKITNPFASRYLYLPIAGFCLLIAVALIEPPHFNFLQISPIYVKRITVNIIVILSIFYFVFTAGAVANYKNNLTFWSKMVRHYPNSALAHSSLGTSLLKNGFLDQAMEEYKIAFQLYACSHSKAETVSK